MRVRVRVRVRVRGRGRALPLTLTNPNRTWMVVPAVESKRARPLAASIRSRCVPGRAPGSGALAAGISAASGAWCGRVLMISAWLGLILGIGLGLGLVRARVS